MYMDSKLQCVPCVLTMYVMRRSSSLALEGYSGIQRDLNHYVCVGIFDLLVIFPDPQKTTSCLECSSTRRVAVTRVTAPERDAGPSFRRE